MTRRTLLGCLAGLPFLGWLRPAEAVEPTVSTVWYDSDRETLVFTKDKIWILRLNSRGELEAE